MDRSPPHSQSQVGVGTKAIPSMSPVQHPQATTTTTSNSSRPLLLLLSLSLLPLYTLARPRWIRWVSSYSAFCFTFIFRRQEANLLFTFVLSRRFSSPITAPPTAAYPKRGNGDNKQQVNKPREEKKTGAEEATEAAVGIATGLQEILDEPSDWVNVYPTPGIEVLKHRSINALYAVRTEQLEDEGHNPTLEQLVRCIRDSKQWEWDHMCESGMELGHGISWVRLKGFWPIKPKELVIRSCMFRLPSGSSGAPSEEAGNSVAPVRILAASSSTTHPAKQSTLEIKYAGYLIEQLAPSSGLRVTQVVDLSGFGVLPTFVTKAVLCKFVPSSFRKLASLAQRHQPTADCTVSDPEGAQPGGWMPPMLGASPPPPTMTTTPQGAEASRAAPGDRDRLKAELDELRKVVDSLQLQKLSKHPHPDSPSKLSAVSFAAAAAAAAVTIAASSWAYKKGLWIRRDKNRSLFWGNEWASDDLVFLLDFLSRKRE
ncbi:hypothetical protein PCANC_01360 [Puccinia coronata f. sp. avenae]|uniref:START domain-containing protein n=1 Tax=Puccinia coronata f. sp. avenae TaxID=200324 RepID=A0A2N5W684_9BASI|nr:hypothetical protein PCANC_01360 [Puccinia coronata f. sp. avenae]